MDPVPTILGTLPEGFTSGTVAAGDGAFTFVLQTDKPAFVWLSNLYHDDAFGTDYFDGFYRNASIDGVSQWAPGGWYASESWRVLPPGDHTIVVTDNPTYSWGVSMALAAPVPEPGPILLAFMLACAAAFGLLRRKR